LVFVGELWIRVVAVARRQEVAQDRGVGWKPYGPPWMADRTPLRDQAPSGIFGASRASQDLSERREIHHNKALLTTRHSSSCPTIQTLSFDCRDVRLYTKSMNKTQMADSGPLSSSQTVYPSRSSICLHPQSHLRMKSRSL